MMLDRLSAHDLGRALRRWLPILAVSLVGGVLGSAFFRWVSPQPAVSAVQPGYGQTRLTSLSHTPAPTDVPISFADAASAATESVVFIQTLTENRRQADEFWSFWDFFGQRGPISGAGSGVVIAVNGSEGYIVTNFHVVQNADRIDVSLRNKHTYRATLVGTDPNTDLALVKIEAPNLKPLALANSDQLRIGEWVLAIGNPFNLQYTVTAGIVSAKGRNINILNTEFPIESFIQTDAAINPGNSGGALVNAAGQLVGVNAAIATRTGAYNGYGFAIPANIVRKVVSDLREFGQVQRAFAGAEVLDIDSQVGKDLPGGDYSGVMVSKVEPDGPASKSGLAPGDVILAINDAPVNTKAEYLEHLSYYRPGQTVTMTTRRETKTETRRVTLVNEDGGTGAVRRTTHTDSQLGVDITPISKAEQSKYSVEAGYRLSNIRGRMAQLGLPEGFVVLRINGYVPEKPEEIGRLLLNSRGRVVVEGLQPNGQRVAFSIMNY